MNVQRPPTNIPLGRQGENLATCIIFDCTGLVQLYGDGTAELLHELKSGTVYPVAVTQDGASVSWTVSASDTATVGAGRAELRWYVGDTLAKSAKFRTSVSSALADSTTETPPAPHQSWVDKVLKAAQEIKDGVISDEKLAAAIAAYLKEHPIDAGLDEAALAAYLTENGYLTDAALADAITQALAEAKASGQFDGAPGKDGANGADGQPGTSGKSAYQYAQEGGYTGTEEEFAAKMAQEIPTVDATLTQAGRAADAAVVGEQLGNLSEEIGDLSSFRPTVDYAVGIFQNKDGIATFNPAGTEYHCAVIDVHSHAGKRVSLTLHHASNIPSFVTDCDMNIIDTITTTGNSATIDRYYEITLGENAYYLILNNYGDYESVVDGIDYTVSDMLKKIPDVVQSDGDSDSSVMSQKAVTAYVQDRIPSINIEPVLPTYNKIPTVDSEVAIYLDNMFIGISPREAKLVTSQNANIRFYDKTVAIIPNATQSGRVMLHLNDDSTYQVSKTLVFESTTQKVGNKNVLFIGDSMTENLSYIKALKTISDAGDYKLRFLGTQFNPKYPDLLHEGRGGWAAYNFCNNDVFSNKTNAFWDGSKFNFSWYMQNSGIDVPDYIFINLGTNDVLRGIPNGATDEEMEEIITSSYQAMIDSIREYSSTIPIVLWLPPTRSLVGRNNHIAIDKCLRVNKWLIGKFDKKRADRIYLMHTYLFVNPYTDYPTITTTIDGVEYVDGTEAIHPSDAGGEKIAKGIIRQMMYIDGLIS